jgi:hypothetical protein
LGNRLIYDELNYDAHQQKEEFNELYKSLTGEFQMLHISGICYNVTIYTCDIYIIAI